MIIVNGGSMLRVSDYNIYIEMNDNEYLLIQGLVGSFDIVKKRYVEILKNSTKDSSYLNDLPNDIKKELINRGYITSLTKDKEFLFIQKLCKALNDKQKDNINITIMPTYNCNFRCEYCFEGDLQKEAEILSKTMSTDTINAVFSQIDKFIKEGKKINNICLFGGEPLLKANYDIVEDICNKANIRNIDITCISNGYDLDKFIDLIKKFNFKYTQITIDGVGKEHDKRRYLANKKGTFDTIIKNVELGLKNGLNIVLRTNVNQKNIDSIDKVMKLYKDKGFTKYDNFSYYFKSTMKCFDKEKDSLSEIELMKKLSKMYGDDTSKFRFNSIYNSLQKSIKNMLEKKSLAPFRAGYCGASGGMYTIAPDGDIYPCLDILCNEKYRIGYVDTKNNEFVFTKQFEEWKGRTVEKVVNCKDCKYMLFCGGGCMAYSIYLYDDINIGYCDDFKKIFEQVAKEVCSEFLNEHKES